MRIPSDQTELTALFEKLGARDASDWARSQLKEGIPQLQRYLFLRQAWADVLGEADTTWIDGSIQLALRNPGEPFAGLGLALERARSMGVSPRDLTEIARGVQVQLLFNLCYRLDDPMFEEEELEDFSWGLFQMDEHGNPVSPRIGGLHESVLETDPSGREMRPRENGDA